MPLYSLRCRVPIKLVADIDQILDGSNIDVVDRGEIQDDSLESRPVVFDVNFLALLWAWVIPWTILR